MTSKLDVKPSAAGGAFEAKRSFDLDGFAARYGGVTVSRLRAGSLIYSQGEPADALYFIKEGQIQISVVSSHGKEGIIEIVEAGDFCGVTCLVGNHLRLATATCLADSVAARLERANVLRAVRENPDIAEYFVTLALSWVVRLRESLISQLLDSSERRLARALLLLANYGKDDEPANEIRNIDQEGLAQLVGTTRSRVNHFMNKFRKLNYIDYDGGVIVVHGSLSNFALGDRMLQASQNDDRSPSVRSQRTAPDATGSDADELRQRRRQ